MLKDSPYRWCLHNIVRIIRNGGVVAYPTEGVWGLGCDPGNPEAVARLLALKKRPLRKGLILVAANTGQIAPLLDNLTPEQRQQLDQLWPGFVTCLLPDPKGWTPHWIRGDHHTVAVRVSAHPPVVALCEAFGGPLVSTSCNPSDRPPARSASEVRRYFGNRIDNMFPETLGGEPGPSPILDLGNDTWVRQ
ncbi:Sua5/YciO/YrdC/YwlC family protein [Marinobacteraceae bacterium S3BR75-40.1]